MNYNRSKNLGKTIEVKAVSRPIKIAYLVPHEESESNHWIIDAVFHESYTRWAGALTLLIPTNSNNFLYKEYEGWLELYDPDFVYTYVDLDKEFIEKIDHLCCPIAFLCYKNNSRNSDVSHWQGYLPEWGHYFKPVSSLSTIHSPYADYPRKIGADKIVLTQFERNFESRFLTDNFGIAFDLLNITNPRKGLYETCCLAPDNLAKIYDVGTTRITSFAEVISQIANNKAISISRLAIIHSKSVPRVRPRSWGHNFDLFVGESCLDRIHFWNGRHLSSDYYGVASAFLVNKDLLNNTEFIKQLGQFFNNQNYIGQGSGSGPPRVAIRSYSHTKEELSSIIDKLIKCTFNHVLLINPHNIPAIPTEQDLKNYYRNRGRNEDITTFKVSENCNNIQATEPEHFAYTPMRYRGINRGHWAVDLGIERHNNLSRYSNVIDKWKLPRRKKMTSAFTRNLSKVSNDHLLTLLPTTDSFPFWSESVKNDYYFDLSLPNDENVFRLLLLDFIKHSPEDLRSPLDYDSYKGISISDKGQNLRGVISMFDNSIGDSACLTNRFWREIIRDSQTVKDEEESQDKVSLKNSDHIFTYEKLFAFLPNDRQFKENLKKKLHISDVNKYLRENFTETLEFMINKNVFYQVHQWRCSYCGHSNMRTFDHMKKENICEICNRTYFAPINIEWKYKLNDFIYRSLCEHNGLTVLWALNKFQDRSALNSFYYLPEVDLFLKEDSNEPKNEIDILCVLDGKYYATEVKKSANSFTSKPDEIDNFIEKIKLIKPDIALLVFEQYCEEGDDAEPTKEKLKKMVTYVSENVGNYIRVEAVVASDYPEFSEYPVDLGYY